MSQTGPSNVIPLLGTSRTTCRCDPLQLALALRRVHAAGLRRGFILLAPARLVPGNVGWWIGVCHAIVEQTRLWIALVEVPDREAGVEWPHDRMPSRIRMIPDLPPQERAGVIELSWGVLSDDHGFLKEAGLMGVPVYDRVRIDAAIRGRGLSALLERPIRGALPVSA